MTKEILFEGSKSSGIFSALFDSGASMSFIKESIADRLDFILPLPKPMIFQTLDNCIEANKFVRLDFYLDGNRLSDEFLVLPDYFMSEDVIIGLKTMRAWGMIVDYGNAEIFSNSQKHFLKIIRNVGGREGSKVSGLSQEEMEKGKILYEDKEHKFIWLGWSYKASGEVQANQYLILDEQDGILLDPGGIHIFPHVISRVTLYASSLDKIKYIFYSHQDPDVSSGIGVFMSSCKNARFLISKLWLRFVPHFGFTDVSRIEPIPDKGMDVKLSNSTLKIIPAHFLHSEGNFSLYDPRAKILFSGDIGASVLPDGEMYFEVENFEKHIRYMEGFHRRYMKGQNVLRKWVSIVRKFDIEVIAPQHGAIMKGENAKKFLNWLENLRCGADIIDEIYGI